MKKTVIASIVAVTMFALGGYANAEDKAAKEQSGRNPGTFVPSRDTGRTATPEERRAIESVTEGNKAVQSVGQARGGASVEKSSSNGELKKGKAKSKKKPGGEAVQTRGGKCPTGAICSVKAI